MTESRLPQNVLQELASMYAHRERHTLTQYYGVS